MEQPAFKGGGWAWAYFIDFDKHMLETWICDSEAFSDKVSFEKMVLRVTWLGSGLRRTRKLEGDDVDRYNSQSKSLNDLVYFSSLLVYILVLCYRRYEL